MTAVSDRRSWRSFTNSFAAAGIGTAVLLYGFIVLLDPYGTRASPSRGASPIMDLNQRFMYPQVVRSGRFDSAVFGTSTVRLLDPIELDRAFGARFANLGLNAGTPWEQMQLADLFVRQVREPKAMIFGLDTTWCEHDADQKKLTFRAFPAWLYDDARWNDLPELFNLKTLEVAGRLVLHLAGRLPERIRGDGYELFLPDDRLYDLARARSYLAAESASPADAVALRDEEHAALRFPALAWLDALLARVPRRTAVTLATTPLHARSLAPPGTRPAAVDAACKASIAAIASSHGATFVDFRISSPVTREDSNYWDPLHYRVGIAARVIESIAAARATGRDAADGFYRVLSRTGS